MLRSSAKIQIAPRPIFQLSSYVPARTVVLLVIFRVPVNGSAPKREPAWIALPSRIGSAIRLLETVLSRPP
jgi:hypothetical protein